CSVAFGRRGRRRLAEGSMDAEPLQAVDLGRLVLRTVDSSRRLLEPAIAVLVDVEDGLPLLHATATTLEQMVLNLVLAARDAMPSGGRLHIAVRRVDSALSLEVTDTGRGFLHLFSGIEPATTAPM